MNILAVDSTGDGLTLAVGDGVSTPISVESPTRRQDEELQPLLAKVLKKARLKLGELDAVAAACGPGRFTGIRVGMTFAGMLARCIGRPALAVSHFEAAAAVAREGRGRFYVDFRDRRGDHFIQVFRTGPRGAAPAAAPFWTPGSRLRDELARLAKSGGRMPGYRFDRLGFGAVALLPPARVKLDSKDFGEFHPLYLKPAHYERPKHGR